MKKSLSIMVMFVLLTWSAAGYAATFDATGTWTFNFSKSIINPSGVTVSTFNQSADMLISQTNDEFYLESHFYGSVDEDYYQIEGPTGGLGDSIPPDSRPWSFYILTNYEPDRYAHMLYDDYHWTLEGTGDTLSGYFHCTYSGYYTSQPGPGTLYYDVNMVDWVAEGSFTGTRAVPIPGTAWFFGSGLIGLLGFSRKFRKA